MYRFGKGIRKWYSTNEGTRLYPGAFSAQSKASTR
jgi:hypothetical protein